MQDISLDRSGLAQTTAVSVLTLAALVLLGVVLAYWTWAWLAPHPESRAPVAVQAGGRMEAALSLFGSAKRDRSIAAPTGIAIKLLGVVAASGGRRGYAVVQLEAKQILAVHEGEDIAPGIRLAEVHADHAILERNGTRETLSWPEKVASVKSPVPPTNK